MNVLVCLDSFKGSLTSLKAGNIVKETLQQLNKNIIVQVCPISDGGEGFLDSLANNCNYEVKRASVTAPLGGEQLIKNYLEIFLIELIRSLTETKKGNSSFLKKSEYDNKFVDDIIKILNENVESKVEIKDVCDATAYSRAHIFREFKKVTGKTVMNYYCDLIMEKAKQLLRETDFSINYISEILSFDTPNYFSKTFKKKIGLTPLQYKKRYLIK